MKLTLCNKDETILLEVLKEAEEEGYKLKRSDTWYDQLSHKYYVIIEVISSPKGKSLSIPESGR